VFFVLSGYLITGLLIAEVRATGRVDFAAFYARRARRLLPAAFTVLVATMLIGRAIYAPVEHRDLANAGLATALYISNILFARSATDYLAQADTNPLLHTWSLAVEEQFYLFWPALVLIALAGRGGRIRPARLATTMVVLGAASLAFCVWLTGESQPWAFFLLPTRAWEFAIGALARMVPAGWVPVGGRTRGLAWLGFLAVLAAGAAFGSDTTFPGAAAAIPVLGTGLLLAAGSADENTGPLRLLTTRPMQRIGQLSYSWYLWHWPVLIYAHVFPALRGVMPSIALAGAALGLAALTHVFVENPIRFHRRVSSRPRLALGLALVLTVAGASAAVLIRALGERQSVTPEQIRYTAARDLPAVYADGCHLPIVATEIEACEYGDTASRSALVLFGDSHAAQWFPALESVARQNRLKLISLTKSGCPAASVQLQSPQLGRTYTECAEWRAAAIDHILEVDPVAVVISSYSGFIAPAGSPDRWSIGQRDWRIGVERTVAAFVSADIRTVLLADTPLPDFDVPTCLARAAWNPTLHRSRCEFERTSVATSLEHEIARAVAASLPGITFVDLTDVICDSSPCAPDSGGVIRYRDSHHLSTRFAASLGPILSRRILAESVH
jgi:peptidoglycan/LPS O-acetylase OafA/YrhL